MVTRSGEALTSRVKSFDWFCAGLGLVSRSRWTIERDEIPDDFYDGHPPRHRSHVARWSKARGRKYRVKEMIIERIEAAKV